MKNQSGCVYALKNVAMPGLYKIGRTTKSARARAHELSAATGVPEPFDVVLHARVADACLAESLLHETLTEFRHSGRREFFAVPYAILHAGFMRVRGLESLSVDLPQAPGIELLGMTEIEAPNPHGWQPGCVMDAFEHAILARACA